jgi:DNA modification methylase
MLEINKIYLGDCMDFMKQIPDKSIDLILTDPPYGCKIGGAKPFGKIGGAKPFGKIGGANLVESTTYLLFDDSSPPQKEYFEEIIRISRSQIIFGGNYFSNRLPPSSCWLIWDKDNTGNFADCELIWTSFNTAARLIKYRWNGLLQQDMAHKDIRVHPTQKPVKLIMKILQNYSKRGDLICDPFLGSGTTAVACLKTNRNFIGMEKEKKYYEIALSRIEKARNKSLDDFVWKDEQVKMKT